MALKRKKKKELGKIRGGSSGGSSVESSPLRPKLVEKAPPCMGGCPQGTNIRGILTTLQFGEKNEAPREETFRKAYDVLVDKNPLPAICGRVCPHPCEVECNRKDKEDAVSINDLERFLGDYALEKGWGLPKDAEESHDEAISVIGAGPAGLTCAYHLARKGYPVTIYEAFEKPGGMLRYGIPPYRLPHDVIDAEVKRITDLGVTIEYGVIVGKDIPIEEIRDRSRATFVGIGAHVGKTLRCEGEDAVNVLSGTEFLHLANSGSPPEVGDKVLVIGGGDTAIDAARVSKRLGADVTIVYRRTRAEMPAIDEEVDGAEEEGITMHFLAQPVVINKEGDVAKSMTCLRCELGEPDESGRRRPVKIDGSEFDIGATTIIAAISQEPGWEGFEDVKGGERWLNVDEDGHTPMEHVFAGGDVIDLGLVTIAIAQGRLAAETIHRELRGLPAPEPEKNMPIIKADQMMLGFYEQKLRAKCDSLPVEERFANPDREIVSGLSEDEAIAEAARCMSCGSCFDCGTCWSYCQDGAIIKAAHPGEPYKFKMDFCNGCKKCAEQCPCGYIEMH